MPTTTKGDSIHPLQPAFPPPVSSVVSLCCVSARERERYRFKALAKSRALSCVQGRRGVKGVGRGGAIGDLIAKPNCGASLNEPVYFWLEESESGARSRKANIFEGVVGFWVDSLHSVNSLH
ncbi:hypothetical protein CDAR_461331 [Caerostris darwini]|uniref:Uncharacterized protein n=1 Tax=Caerostris darwini TaxID=1538125 RepID=A0AAV4SBH2_9ARAC|nr:hypothetical protein CDAR_461331 [Caerostris darwini]